MPDCGLDNDVRYLKGVGPYRAEAFAQVGIRTLRDLLNFFPRRYRFFGQVKKISQLVSGEEASILAKIDWVEHQFNRRLPRTIVHISDDTGFALVRWFRSPYLREKLITGYWVKLSGKVTFASDGTILTNPKLEIFTTAPSDTNKAYTLPVYPSIQGIPPGAMPGIVNRAIDTCQTELDDWLDESVLQKRNLIPVRQAYRWIHKPEEQDSWSIARRRLAYDELFFMQMGILLSRRQRISHTQSIKIFNTPAIDIRIRNRFPFPLTPSQNKVINEIAGDMRSDSPMYRLLQGDVGSGKTVVALYAALMSVASQKQVAIMAPTEILAYQHYKKVTQYLDGARVQIALLVGGMKKGEREKIIESVRSGQVDIVIGTHALLRKDVEFANLALVIVDEQHKFGVAQRATIQSKGQAPHYLVMTATPIPRTLALTIFGDLQVSTIDKMPPGRIPVKTILYRQNQLPKIWEFLRDKLNASEQGFVVYPLLHASDKIELKSATEQKKILSKEIFPEFNVELIHGKLKSGEKRQIMQKYARKEIDLLVATVVIEVGIDVPDASVLVIEHAERFGLSQLHQLRGRIGRGGQQGYCLLTANLRTEEAKKRLGVFTKTNDGFRIAEEDLRIRGPGEFFGTNQHGLPELKLADLIDDYELLLEARRDVENILKSDPQLEAKNHQVLKHELKYRLKNKLDLISAA